MPAEISQPLPTQQMTASTPADSPCAVDEQPVSPFPTPRYNGYLHSILPTRCLITWPLGINTKSQERRLGAKLLHILSLTMLVLQKPQEPMTMSLRGGGEKEDVCCGLYVQAFT